MRKIIFDCDNTFGLADRDIDDGLTLLYLLGSSTIDLLGVTLTYGNGTLEEVKETTMKMKQALGLRFHYYATDQAKFLVDQVNQFPHEITLIATGALTNLLEACKIDPDFFKKVGEIVLMGGIIEPLVVNQIPVSELNFSCDPLATETVLLSQAPLTIMNGHMTSEAFFSRCELYHFYELAREALDYDILNWMITIIEKWIGWNEKIFGFDGFCNWDMTTVVYLTEPEMFHAENVFLAKEQLYLSRGEMTLAAKSNHPVYMPDRILELTKFNQLVIDGMLRGLKKDY